MIYTGFCINFMIKDQKSTVKTVYCERPYFPTEL